MTAPGPFDIADRRVNRALAPILSRLPALDGRPIALCFQPALTAWRGNLLSGETRGRPVHAGSHMRRRTMVFDAALLLEPDEFRRIFVHEVHHFVWIRLSNATRDSYAALAEGQRSARGELGWSAEGLKNSLGEHPRVRRWRDYVCESFCDTAAWYYSGLAGHAEWTLGARGRAARRRWFDESFGGRPLSL